MRRVRKEEVQIDTWIKPDGFSACLECWKSYMLTDDRDLSASRMMLQGGEADEDRAGYDYDVYAEQRKADYKIGEAANAMIESLKPVHRWAIYKKCGITTVWRFPSADLLQILPTAEQKLEEMLRKNLATAILF